MGAVLRPEGVEERALALERHVVWRGEVEDRRPLRSQERPLIGRRHVATRPILGAGDRPAGGVEHDDEAGEILVDAPEPVVDPRAEAGGARLDLAGVHLEHRRAMNRRVGRHRMEEGDIVDMLRELRKECRDLLPTLPVGRELPLRPHDPSLTLLAAASLRLHLDRLAVEIVELRLVVEGVDMAGAAVHEEEDHALRLGGEVGDLRGQRIGPGLDAVGGPRLPGEEAAVEEPR